VRRHLEFEVFTVEDKGRCDSFRVGTKVESEVEEEGDEYRR
jgi:hypothetical protein